MPCVTYIYKSSSAEMGGYIDSEAVRVNSLPFFVNVRQNNILSTYQYICTYGSIIQFS